MKSLSQSMTAPEFWVDQHGNRPEPGTSITADDVRSGKFSPADPNADNEAVMRFLALVPAEIWPEQ